MKDASAAKESSNSALKSVEAANSSSKDSATYDVSGDKFDAVLFGLDHGSNKSAKRARSQRPVKLLQMSCW